jgi:N-acetylmuramoyl-L-alanine amidase
MRKSLLVALGLAAVSAVCIAAVPRSEPEIETQTIAEYMDEWRRAHPSTETKKSIPVATSQLAVREVDAAGLDFTDEESQMLLKLAMAEAEDQGVIGKALVIRVVKNRVDSEAFPNSIEDVIYDPKQFSPVWDGRYDEAVPDAECYEALEWVLNYWDGSNGALYFEADWNESKWHKENLTELFQYDNLIFYK